MGGNDGQPESCANKAARLGEGGGFEFGRGDKVLETLTSSPSISRSGCARRAVLTACFVNSSLVLREKLEMKIQGESYALQSDSISFHFLKTVKNCRASCVSQVNSKQSTCMAFTAFKFHRHCLPSFVGSNGAAKATSLEFV